MTAFSELSERIAQLRKSYGRAELSESSAPEQPMVLFDQWMQEAVRAELPDPNAMTVATVGSDMRPSTRIVLLKGYDEAGIVWYTNYHSRKGRELSGVPFAALQFHWVELERVVRIEGRVEQVSPRRATPTSTAAPWTRASGPGPAHRAR